MEDVVVETAGDRDDHGMVSRMLSLMAPEARSRGFWASSHSFQGHGARGFSNERSRPLSLPDDFGSFDEANSAEGRKPQWRKNHS